MKYNPVGRVSIYIFSVPIFGVVLSGLLLGEQILSVKNLTALVLVSIGILIVNSKTEESVSGQLPTSLGGE